jgi:hypothetical protein
VISKITVIWPGIQGLFTFKDLLINFAGKLSERREQACGRPIYWAGRAIMPYFRTKPAISFGLPNKLGGHKKPACSINWAATKSRPAQ